MSDHPGPLLFVATGALGASAIDRKHRDETERITPRAVAGDFARLPPEASELVAQGPDLILVQSVPATRALM